MQGIHLSDCAPTKRGFFYWKCSYCTSCRVYNTCTFSKTQYWLGEETPPICFVAWPIPYCSSAAGIFGGGKEEKERNPVFGQVLHLRKIFLLLLSSSDAISNFRSHPLQFRTKRIKIGKCPTATLRSPATPGYTPSSGRPRPTPWSRGC